MRGDRRRSRRRATMRGGVVPRHQFSGELTALIRCPRPGPPWRSAKVQVAVCRKVISDHARRGGPSVKRRPGRTGTLAKGARPRILPALGSKPYANASFQMPTIPSCGHSARSSRTDILSLRPALQGLDLQVQPGEYLAVLGAKDPQEHPAQAAGGASWSESGTLAVCGSVEHDSIRRCRVGCPADPRLPIVATVARRRRLRAENLAYQGGDRPAGRRSPGGRVGLTKSRRKPPHFFPARTQGDSPSPVPGHESPVLAGTRRFP
jgi:hypothetical protein